MPSPSNNRVYAPAEQVVEDDAWNSIAIVRPANVYGAYDNFDPQTAMVVPALISRVVGGENPLVVWGDGSAIRVFIFSRDCALGMLLALEKGANCTPINLGSGVGTLIKELVEAVTACLDNPRRIVWDRSKPSGAPDGHHRAREMIGFEPRTTLQQGVSETVEWYLKNSEIADMRYNVFYRQNLSP